MGQAVMTRCGVAGYGSGAVEIGFKESKSLGAEMQW